VDERFPHVQRPQRELEPARFALADEKLLEEERVIRRELGVFAEAEGEKFIAHAQETRRLETHDVDSALYPGQERVERATRLRFCLAAKSRRQESASAAERTRAAHGIEPHTIARGLENAARRPRVLDGEVVGEGIDEKHHLPAIVVLAGAFARRDA